MRDLVYYIASSVDGMIADRSGDYSHFPVEPETIRTLFDRYPETCPAHLREPLGVTASPRRFDTVLMGARTYAPAVAAGLPGGVYPHLRQIVVTHAAVAADGVEVWSDDVAGRVAALKSEPGRDIWLCGGADLAGQVAGLIDEIAVKVNPVVLGDGIPLFGAGTTPGRWQRVDVEPMPGGVTLLTFRARPGE